MEITFKSDWVVAQATIPTVGAPTNFVATPIAEDTIRLTWDEPAEPVDSYEIEAAKSEDFSDAANIYSGVKLEHFDHSGLERGITYYYRIRSVKQVQ